jgi:hypothetical protein
MGKHIMLRTATSWILLGFFTVIMCAAAPPSQSAPPCAPPDKNPKPRFSIGKDTTRVTGPIDKQGYIDYAAALNERMRLGVTPENNANVVFFQVFGRSPEGAAMPAEFFAWLGLPSPRRAGHFVDLFQYLKETLKVDVDKNAEAIIDQMDRARERPWTRAKYPHLAAWLQANEKPVALVVQGTKRSHYFSPLVPGRTDDGPASLITALIPGVQKTRAFAYILVTRAMFHVGEGRYDDAWQDLLACHRLGRLVARGGTMIDGLVGIAIDLIASEASQVFLGTAKLDAQAAKNCLRDLQALPPMPAMADKVDLAERFTILEMVLLFDRRGDEFLQTLFSLVRDPDSLPKKLPAEINWDPALRCANGWCDRLAAALRCKDRGQRLKQFAEIEKDLKALRVKLMQPGAAAEALQGEKSNAETRGKMLGDMLVCLLMPAVAKVQQAADRNEQIHQNLQVAFALAQYQRERGHYPKKLDELAPMHLAKIPLDIFSGKALKYLPQGDGYLLYSFGVNERDDQGRSYDDDPPGDDLRVMMPLPKPRAR